MKAKDQQIAALQRCYVGYLSDEGKKNGISIITENNDKVEYPDISTYGQHGYRRHKVMVVLRCSKCRRLLLNGDRLNAVITYNFWREHRLIVVDSNRPMHFRLDTVSQEQLLALNDT